MTVKERRGENVLNIYLKTDISAPRRSDAKAMWLVEWVSDKDPEKTVTHDGFLALPDTTEDEIILTALIQALNILNKPCKIRIFTDAQRVLNVLDLRRNEGWRSQKWRSASEKPIKNAPLWEIVTNQLTIHEWSITDEVHSFRDYMRSELKKWQ